MTTYITSAKVDKTPRIVSRTGTISTAVKNFLIRNGITRALLIKSEKQWEGEPGQLIEI